MFIIGIDGSRALAKNKTGIGWYSFYLIKALQEIAKDRNDLKFVLYSNQPLSLLSLKEKETPLNWQIRFLSWPWRFFWTQIRLSLEMMKNPPDVLFVPAHSLPLFCPKFNVLTIHDLGFERFPYLYSRKERASLQFSYRLGAQRAQKIIVPSLFTKKELINFYNINPDKIIFIPLGYDKNIFCQGDDFLKNDQAVLARYKINFPYFLYVGRINKKKNISLLISAFEKFIKKSSLPFKLILISSDNISLGQNNSFLLKLPYLSHKEIASFYRRSEAFIFPSLYEGFGLPLLEAMACGTPVIASRIPAFLEIGKDAPLYFSPHNQDELIFCLYKIINEPELRKKIISRGFEISDAYSWRKCAQQTLKILEFQNYLSPAKNF